MKIHLLKLKAELKVLAVEIRTLKSKRKESRNGYVEGLYSAQQQFRIKHIARCMLRGRKLEEIESKLKDPNGFHHVYVRNKAAEIVKQVLLEEATNAALES